MIKLSAKFHLITNNKNVFPSYEYTSTSILHVLTMNPYFKRTDLKIKVF